MDAEFWLERWATGKTGFHQSEVNPRLVERWPELGVAADARVLVPLCGKSRDMVHLRTLGHRVLGVELSSLAIDAFFREADLSPSKTERGSFTVSSANGIELWQGDVFAFGASELADVAAVYDRASLVALPPATRARYARWLGEQLPSSVSLLVLTFEYEQSQMEGPPFAVHEDEVRRLFEPHFAVELLERSDRAEPNDRFRERGCQWIREAAYRMKR